MPRGSDLEPLDENLSLDGRRIATLTHLKKDKFHDSIKKNQAVDNDGTCYVHEIVAQRSDVASLSPQSSPLVHVSARISV